MRSSWSFDLSHWNSLPIEFLKGNWKQTKVSSVEKIAIPDSPGIYMYCVAVPNAENKNIMLLNNPIYMGITNSLKTRFIQHLKKEDSLYEPRKCYGSNMNFYYLKVKDYKKDQIRLLYEQPMIDCFGKVVNKINSVGMSSPLRGNLGEFKKI